MASSCNSRTISKIIEWITHRLLVFSIIGAVVFYALYNTSLKKEVTLSEGTLVTQIWEDIPLTIYERLYFFNITNESEFLDGKKLNVVEVGPYTYKAEWVKPNPIWQPNHTVSYREVRTYQFVPELSSGSEDDLIYTLNAPLILAANIAKDSFSAFKVLLHIFLLAHKETLITKKSIRQLAYEGYEDAIIKDASFIKDVPFKEGKFAWLYGKNATDDGLFTVFTGEDDASKTNLIHSWNDQEKLSFWKGDSCNAINASTSIETGPPIDDHVKSYTFFQSIFCRSLTFIYLHDTSHHDITVKRFVPSHNLFANSTENPENACFEVDNEHASGVLDTSPCQYGAPVFLAFPHFHLGDPSLLQNIEGLNPNESLHGSHVDVEPITGMSVDLSIKFQVNLKVENDAVLRQFHKSRNGIYPVFWVDLSLNIDEHMADFFKSHVRLPKVIAYSVTISVAVVCLIVIIAHFLVLLFTPKGKECCVLANENSGCVNKTAFPNEPSGYPPDQNYMINRTSEVLFSRRDANPKPSIALAKKREMEIYKKRFNFLL